MAEPVAAFAIDLEVTAAPSKAPALPIAAPPQPAERSPSVVLLPLRNLSDDPRDAHLCDGFTSDIITNLSRFRELLVIARHSAFHFRDASVDLREVGRQLGVHYALTGGMQRSQSRLAISVQLVEISTGGIIWSDRYKGDLSDVFEFQEDITGVIAARCAGQVMAAERRRISSQPPSDLRAYGLVLRGQDLSIQFRKEAVLHARRLFEEAANVDPNYGRSYAGMSRTYNLAWRYRWTDSPEAALDRSVELAMDATRCDNLDARGHAELGVACLYKRQHDASLAAYERAIDLNPNDADILAEMGDSLTNSDNADRALAVLNRAMRLNPLYPDWYLWNMGEAYFNLQRYEEAIQSFKRMHDQSEAHRLLASSYGLLGQVSEARHHASQVLAVHPEFSLEHWRTVPPYKTTAQLERLVEGLQIAGLR
jgi:TolB-like protein/tetratricopeptide (TPR) repeat protein